MKKDQLKSLIRTIVEEITPPQQAADPKAQAFQELDRIAKELAKLKPGTKEHADLSDRYMKIWWATRKLIGLK